MKETATNEFKATVEQYRSAILLRDGRSADLAYSLIHDIMREKFLFTYKRFQSVIQESFEDTLDGFYLYLHDGVADENWVPFNVIEKATVRGSFAAWMESTYRNFLRIMAQKEKTMLFEHESDSQKSEQAKDYAEDYVRVLLRAIAFADQTFERRSMFLLLRHLMSIIEKRLGIKQSMVAEAIDISPIAYRVASKRAYDRFLQIVQMEEKSSRLVLDNNHLKMYRRLEDRFIQIYAELLQLYESIIKELPFADKMQKLRQRMFLETGHEMHEDASLFGDNQINARYILNRMAEWNPESVSLDGTQEINN